MTNVDDCLIYMYLRSSKKWRSVFVCKTVRHYAIENQHSIITMNIFNYQYEYIYHLTPFSCLQRKSVIKEYISYPNVHWHWPL